MTGMSRREQEELEENLNIVLLKMADLQERIWDGLERLEERGLLKSELEEHVHRIMSDVSLTKNRESGASCISSKTVALVHLPPHMLVMACLSVSL